ncbi:acid-sensing ion channel 1A-like [Stegodyphus dumicola]|uniref:acid-sensing ion channel 1A-like n=1 Tax=Stegodyphus dumicola TaxID=202533 RepID=UPI0015B1C36B|nr:acid-sensing ion channel 1A-like [Stegodyphus dumicola]
MFVRRKSYLRWNKSTVSGECCKFVSDVGAKTDTPFNDSNKSIFVEERNICGNSSNLRIRPTTNYNEINHQFIPSQDYNRNLDTSGTEFELNHKKPSKVFVLEDVPYDGIANDSRNDTQVSSLFSMKSRNTKKFKDRKHKKRCYKENTFQVSSFRKRTTMPSTEVDDSYPSEPPPTFKAIAKLFLKKSSVYALNQIGNSKTNSGKLFWSVIMIAGLLGCGSQVFRYMSTFYAYPVVVNIDSVSKFDQIFPAVTICNFNPVRKIFVPCMTKQISYENCNQTFLSSQSKFQFTSDEIQQSCSEILNITCDEDQEIVGFRSLYLNLNAETRKRYGHQAETFIRSCSFRGERCFTSNFSLYQDTRFGNCYTFNKASRNKTALDTSLIGPNGGLELELDLEIDQYIWTTRVEGARVVIHDPYKEPNPQDEGINVSAGYETAVAISMITFHRLPAPYKDQCRRYELEDDQRKCHSNCFYSNLYSSCSCHWPGEYDIKESRYCDMTNLTELICMYRAGSIGCYCPLECDKTMYDMKISSVAWPSRAYTESKLRKYRNERKLKMENLRDTRFKLRVYYDTLQQLIYEQKAKFEDAELLSQIGGQMGLWLGLSLVFLFEWLENCVILWKLWKKKHQ